MNLFRNAILKLSNLFNLLSNFFDADGLTFDRKRHLIGEEFFKQETKEDEEISAENLTRIQTIVSSGNKQYLMRFSMRQNDIWSRTRKV